MSDATRTAVILARGLGTRMQRESPDVSLSPEGRRAAEQGQKTLMPINGRPFFDYIADSLLRAGISRLCLAIAPDGDVMRETARRIARATGAEVECVVQEQPLGTADAALAAEQCVAGEPFILANGDDLYPDDALARLAALGGDECALAAFDAEALARDGNIAADRIRDFALISVGPAGELLDIVEKPDDPASYRQDGKLWLSMNLYRFTPRIFEFCRRIAPDPVRGELELPTAVRDMVRAGGPPFLALRCTGGIFDLTSRADIATAEEALQGRKLTF